MSIEVILLQRVDNLGHIGDVVKVRPGYARNYLLPQHIALRASKDNKARFEKERADLEARNVKRKEEAERLSERMEGLSVVLIRQASDNGSLYGSVTTRDIARAVSESGFDVARQQVNLRHPIKALGVYDVQVSLHPEIVVDVYINVARTEEEAERQSHEEAVSPEQEAQQDGDEALVEGKAEIVEEKSSDNVAEEDGSSQQKTQEA